MSDHTVAENEQDLAAVAEGGAYQVIRARLNQQGNELEQKTQKLNQARLKEFGREDMHVLGRVRVRTENNCQARDIVCAGDYLLFGYNVFIGLKQEIKISDVFGLYKLNHTDAGYEMHHEPIAGSFLDNPRFDQDFTELYTYYKEARLLRLTIRDGKLLASFQIGLKMSDVRVFRWSISSDGKTLEYIDNRGERDLVPPAQYDFEWQECSRENEVAGRFPHMNILDTLFVETTQGDLTVKIENNTDSGLGIYAEDVEDDNQSLDDARFLYAEVGSLILLKILPYREEKWRYLVFNRNTETVVRIDHIGHACRQLPENHGIIFPGGYYLQNGDYKTFDDDITGLEYRQTIKSPNGEDVLYVFYEPIEGKVGLYAYNLINKSLENPLFGHGYAALNDGRVVLFYAEGEPTRVHPMQIWQTPFCSDEYASAQPTKQSFYGKIGNAELVRGISELFSTVKAINNQTVSTKLYSELIKNVNRMFDSYHWMAAQQVDGIESLLRQIAATAELVLDEFEKVETIRQQARQALQQAQQQQSKILSEITPDSWQTPEKFVGGLDAIRKQKGHLLTIKTMRYMEAEPLAQMGQKLEQAEASLSQKTVEFLAKESSLAPYNDKLASLNTELEKVVSVAELEPVAEQLEQMAAGLDLLSELMATLKVNDATVRTRIIDTISEIYGRLNQTKANAKHKKQSLGSAESLAQFSAQFKLFSQSITNALGLANTPEKADEQLSRLLVQLEELESQFSEQEEFLTDILTKREEVIESFESHRQRMVEARQRKASTLKDAAERILASIARRVQKFTELEQLNTFFASDALALKIYDLVAQLREIDDSVKADDIEAKFKNSKDQAIRSLRDKSEIFEDGGNVIKLGPRHKFTVNTQELDLTLLPKGDELVFHLTGTDYFDVASDAELNRLQDYWTQEIESETKQVYRAEYLVKQILDSAERNEAGLSTEQLRLAQTDPAQLNQLVRDFAAPRYKEGYERGIHDHDASLILSQLLPALSQADVLRFPPLSRGFSAIFWANCQQDTPMQTWPERAKSALRMEAIFNSSDAKHLLEQEIKQAQQAFAKANELPLDNTAIDLSARYLVQELAKEPVVFATSKYADHLAQELRRAMDTESWNSYQHSLEKLKGKIGQRWALTQAWLQALVSNKAMAKWQAYIPEAVALINGEGRLSRRVHEVELEFQVEGLMGQHSRIKDRKLDLSLDDFLQRLEHHQQAVLPGYNEFLSVRNQVTQKQKTQLRLSEFKPRPLSSFVRNKLINDAYLPIIGDNLAKQMGTVGESKRTDLMGLLMLISPPGYGKTTLMEYIASRLGLIFMKINCPSIGHVVDSLDPAQAPNATAKAELIKLNLGLEMGNNVMLYLDDIQHTNPEFLQKFISLCDGTRRIEGIWQGQPKTYDLRGKKFCVIMAGNPYTESGEAFQIPDMLANRADIYNLGDILGGMDEAFALSYLENGMTSNPVLAPLATRSQQDFYKLVELAKGNQVDSSELEHGYSGAELNEITGVLAKLLQIQQVVLAVNQSYIASAAQADKYRTEPPFKLQGSYRNMNKMAEKVSSVMNDDELMQLIEDHYLGEAQMLAASAEENLLKLAELRGNMTPEQAQRWQQIKDDYVKHQTLGGDSDVTLKAVSQLLDMNANLNSINDTLSQTRYRFKRSTTETGKTQVSISKKPKHVKE
ncbi:DNA repair ATPase [Motilimonas eburnea]|uniref:DNA repair ATPase n=1 Tax=Motilimonas eburnea TaxID=1737488 RepID=UPI001E2D8539|nr:DNA repair ATPase [Motilimonas eburnea]MCE2571304.1 DNA repair ATPase [Motilimonas eburnea]